jgi:hypothetical protein
LDVTPGPLTDNPQRASAIRSVLGHPERARPCPALGHAPVAFGRHPRCSAKTTQDAHGVMKSEVA